MSTENYDRLPDCWFVRYINRNLLPPNKIRPILRDTNTCVFRVDARGGLVRPGFRCESARAAICDDREDYCDPYKERVAYQAILKSQADILESG